MQVSPLRDFDDPFDTRHLPRIGTLFAEPQMRARTMVQLVSSKPLMRKREKFNIRGRLEKIFMLRVNGST
jgi:hypothetical protein